MIGLEASQKLRIPAETNKFSAFRRDKHVSPRKRAPSIHAERTLTEENDICLRLDVKTRVARKNENNNWIKLLGLQPRLQ